METVEKDLAAGRVYLRAFYRLHEIDRQIRNENFPSVCHLAESLGVNERTVKRDLAVMRDSFNAPLIYERRKRGFRYAKTGWELPLKHISEGDLLAFFIAENALRFTGHTPEALKLKHSLAKLAYLLPAQVSVNLATLGENVSFQSLPFASAAPEVLDLLAQAAISNQIIEFDYYSPHRREHSKRYAGVLLLHNFAGDWFAVCLDDEKKDYRDFHAGRMKNVRLTSRFFDQPKRWNAEDYLKSGFFMMRGGRLTEVEIVFNSFRAQWIRERESFHPEETREELLDGGLRLKFKIGEQGLEAVARFCLSYAGDCQAVKPAKLRKIIEEKLETALSQYKN